MKIALLVLLGGLCCSASCQLSDNDKKLMFYLPVKNHSSLPVSIIDIFPEVDNLLRLQYWYFLRKASIITQTSIDTTTKYLIFIIYRNFVGTFLVITTWLKKSQELQVNTFIRLGNGLDIAKPKQYPPLKIQPWVVRLDLAPDQYIVTVNPDGTVSVNPSRLLQATTSFQSSIPAPLIPAAATNCTASDKFNRDKYWYFVQRADLLHQSKISTTKQLWCIFIYVDFSGSYLSISHHDYKSSEIGVNTLVRLGSGKNSNNNDGTSIEINPAIVHLSEF